MHIFTVSYHPQGRAEIESFTWRIKEKLFLIVFCSPYLGKPEEGKEGVRIRPVMEGRT
jgi:hypothetical protein